MKRFAAAAIGVVMLVIGVGSAAAEVTVETFPVEFVITSDQCSNLLAGTTITGSGTQKSVTTATTNASGVTTVGNTSIATGTATDQAGNTYVFSYKNTFNVSNTLANQAMFSGRMVDQFTLTGRGPARLTNGFVATFTTDFEVFSFQPNVAWGDPISFPEGEAHCDPL